MNEIQIAFSSISAWPSTWVIFGFYWACHAIEIWCFSTTQIIRIRHADFEYSFAWIWRDV